MGSQNPLLNILMFPWLAHAHIVPYELSKRILNRTNFNIYFCSTPANFSSIRSFIHRNSLEGSIELVGLYLRPNPQLPPPYHTTKNLPSNLVKTLLAAFQTAQSSFSDIIGFLKPDMVIYDVFQPWAATVAASQGIPAVHFASFGAAMMAYVYHNVCVGNLGNEFPFQELCLNGCERGSVVKFIGFLCDNVYCGDKDVIFVNYKLSCEVVLLKTSWGLEGKYLDYVSHVCNKKLLPAVHL